MTWLLYNVLLALQIERYYTKNQIMELYANHVFVGANAYGVEAGAETYFGKQAKDLTLARGRRGGLGLAAHACEPEEQRDHGG